MTVLIIDRDRTSFEHMTQIMDEHKIPFEQAATRDQAIEMMRQTPYSAIVFDPAPQNEIRPFVLAARRMAKQYPFIILTSHTIDAQKALAGGCNDHLQKPFDSVQIQKKIEAAERLGRLVSRLSDEREDFPSKDGVIAKSAFNQLFISCLDRADRYGEQSYIIFVKIRNFAEIVANEGQSGLSGPSDALKKYITRIRRLSDIAGQISVHEFALLLLRPAREDEPFLAANRFSELLQDFHDLISCGKTNVELTVSLVSLPAAQVLVEHTITGKATV